MSKTTLRYGLIGAGMMGREHVRNIALVPGGIVTAISDPDEGSRDASAAQVAKVMGRVPRAFRSHRDLLEKGEVDALVIASPNDTHKGVLSDVFEAKWALPVLVEKPVCTTAAHCRWLAEAGSAHKAPIWVAMEYRYMPPVQELMAELKAGTAGTLQMLAIREHRFPFLEKVGDWNRFSKRTGGTLVEKCCHFFDLLRLIMAEDPIRVFASGAMDVNHRAESYAGRTPDILDNAYVIVDFASGRRAMLDLCMFAEGSHWQEIITATGDRGRVEAFIPGPARFWPGGKERHAEIEVSPREPKGPKRRPVHVDDTILMAGDHHGSTYYQHLGFHRAVTAGGRVEVTLADGLKAVMIGLAAEKSARTGRAVALDLALS
jgi:myo-inositol 2-dehydrogenase / D-chiro-inositol 1-dehydrogenase